MLQPHDDQRQPTLLMFSISSLFAWSSIDVANWNWMRFSVASGIVCLAIVEASPTVGLVISEKIVCLVIIHYAIMGMLLQKQRQSWCLALQLQVVVISDSLRLGDTIDEKAD